MLLPFPGRNAPALIVILSGAANTQQTENVYTSTDPTQAVVTAVDVRCLHTQGVRISFDVP
jgi:hypothetical protein